MNYSNYHTHTVYCDGKSTVEENIQKAISLGCPQIGFSGHSYSDIKQSCFSMTRESTVLYKNAVTQAKEKYKDLIKVFGGIEQDLYSTSGVEAYDYIIGSVHYIKKDGEFLPIDKDAKNQISAVNKYFGGDFFKYTEAYYDTLRLVKEKTKCQIVGHFDIVTKFNEGNALFDESSPLYRKRAIEVLEELSEKKLVFELNSGAVSRGYRTECYPAAFILEALSALKAPVVISSDAHHCDNLLFGFEKMSELVKKYKLTVFDNIEDILSYAEG